FARQGFRVYVPNYRLAPEYPFPGALEDALAVYRALLAATPANRIVFAGDSAGGGLALALLLAARDAGLPEPAAAVLFWPWPDWAAPGDSISNNVRRCAMFEPESIRTAASWYLAGVDARNPLASPLYADFSGLPPLLIHVAQDELFRDDSTRL